MFDSLDKAMILGAIGAFFGAIGTILGIINTWNSLSKNRVRLKVTPKFAYPVGPGFNNKIRLVSIEVVNSSSFAVTISEIGFLLRDKKTRLAFVRPIIIDGGNFPRRLEPRSSFTVYADPNSVAIEGLAQVECAYASTDCEKTQRGTSEALSILVSEAQAKILNSLQVSD